MRSVPDGATFDMNTAALQANGGWLALRTDIRPEEQCYVALDPEKGFAGVLQGYKDGTASFSDTPGVPYTPAKSLDDAFARLFVVTMTVKALACPRCKKAYKVHPDDDQFGEWVRCRECGSQIPTKAKG